MTSLEKNALILGSLTVLLFGIVAGYIGYKKYHQQTSIPFTNADFVTARNSLGYLVIAWSIFSNAAGAGLAFFPPAYASSPGIGLVGAISNTLANMLPPFLISHFGSLIRSQYPEARSLSHYMSLRYSSYVQFLVCVIVIFNMAMALMIEYTAISSIYRHLVGTEYAYIVIGLMALVTSSYTSYGGLYASLVTDQWQGLVSTFLIFFFTIYTLNFSGIDLSGPYPDSLTTGEPGWSSIMVLPISIVSGTLLSEASFQRVWAAYDNKTLKIGAIIGSLIIGIVVFLFSMGGIIVVWSGRHVSDHNNILFGLVGPEFVPQYITIIAVLVITILSMSAVDSIQNGLAAAITTNYFHDQNVWYPRFLVFLMNTVSMAMGYQSLNSIVTLFSITNVITTVALVFFVGLYFKSTSSNGVLFGFLFGLTNIFIYGWIMTGHFIHGLKYIFIDQVYNYPPFLVALTSLIGLAGWETLSFILSKHSSHSRHVTFQASLDNASISSIESHLIIKPDPIHNQNTSKLSRQNTRHENIKIQ